jgi:thioredoxin-like negative regulator of GroEL
VGGGAQEIEWQPSLDAAISEAKRSGRPIVVDFFATWCGPCKMMDEKTYPDPSVAAEAQRWVMVRVDVDKHPQIAQRYNVTAMPTVAFLKSDGTPATGFQGFAPPDDMLNMMQQAYPKAQS